MSELESAFPALKPDDREPTGFVRGLGLFDSTMIVVGSMIGSGIFIVSADISRNTGSSGGLLAAWVITGLMTVAAALSYGELAAMMPKAGGQYVYLREAYSPLWGFLYGWTLFLVIQTGTIAAVAVGFARFLGVVWPAISPNRWVVPPIALSTNYALSLSVQQLIALLLIVFLTLINTRGLKLGKWIQNIFTSAKTLGLAALILAGVFFGRNAAAIHANFSSLWATHDPQTIHPGAEWMKSFIPSVTAASGFFGLLIAFGVSQVGSLFSADAWNNITFTAGEVKNPKRDIPISLAVGTAIVIFLYFLANVGYLSTLTLHQIQVAPDDRVATATLAAIFGNGGATLMAVAIMVSTFGCANGLILAGARVYYAMAHDGVFFRGVGKLNAEHVPSRGLLLQGVWAGILVLLRTRLVDPATGAVSYGNLYSVLLDYVIFAALMFYVLTIGGIFVLRRKRPDAARPYRAWGYPLVPILYIVTACIIMLILILYQTQDTWPGLLIVLLGVPVYWVWSWKSRARAIR
ncbi:MAG TPA: amino acid permease [Candidatus Dormibacteraeota bacterium]|nr:amino acid permease [Candidatus Dormibacteraeota bacterium]